MVWKIKYKESVEKDFKQLDKAARKKILDYLDNRIAKSKDPTEFAKPLRKDLLGLWRFRVMDYRIIAKIDNSVLTVLVLRVGHRKDVYI